MRVTLFGTRGSMPNPDPAMARFGGNTATVEVRSDDGTILILDAGTGIRGLGDRISSDVERVDILLTHLHMDHIQGLGFFRPLHRPETEVHIWGPASGTRSLSARLSRYLSPPLFPVHFRDLPSVNCHEVPKQTFNAGPFEVDASLVWHPDPTLGYRICLDGRSVAYIPDHEPALCQCNGRWPRPEWISGYQIAAGADLLIHDAQYTDDEYARFVGHGHSSYRHAFEFATLTEVEQLVPFHHDPAHDDDMLERLLGEAMQRQRPDYRVSRGLEGAAFDLRPKPR